MKEKKEKKTSIVIATGKSEAEYSKGLEDYEKDGVEPKASCWICRRVQGEKTVKLIDNQGTGEKIAQAYETELYYSHRKVDKKEDVIWQYCLCADCINLVESESVAQ
ncbi:MAG: hypothetical protein ACUZ8E_16385 [Candidatus Anammoxibacter sp.]